MECVVHYVMKDVRYSELKALSRNQYERLNEAKQIRQQSTERNQHSEQCSLIPEGEFDVNLHGIHLEPCYKKFTGIIAKSKKRKAVEDILPVNRPKRSKNDTTCSTSGIFPKNCIFCKKWRITIKRKIFTPHTLTTLTAGHKIKQAAERKNDTELIVQISAVDLIAKELIMHKQCYLDYVRCLGEIEANKDEADEAEAANNFPLVKDFIQEAIIEANKAVSMKAIHSLYKTGYGHAHEKVYRNRLKSKIINEFGNQLKFLRIDGQTPEVIVSTEGLDSTTVIKDKSVILKKAAEYLRQDILDYAAKIKSAKWPPTFDSLKEDEQEFPQLINEFLTCLLKPKDQTCSESVKRMISSFGYDLIHGVTNGRVITLKHFLLGLGLHNITGLKLPIKALSHLGHCINYDLVCEIETAEAEVAQNFYENNLQRLQGELEGETQALTYWWADNFNQTLDSTSCHGVINSTHVVEFTEQANDTVVDPLSLSIPRSKRRSLPEASSLVLPEVRVNKLKEPVIVSSSFSETDIINLREKVDSFERFYAVWVILRLLNSADQELPMLSGWSIRVQQTVQNDVTIQKTKLTYLPPINAPITDFATMAKVFETVQERAKRKNTLYANITLDVGAAMTAYKVLWNYQDRFKNVIIHLGDFHFMKEVFAVLGKLVTGSGFEDIVFQAGLCSAGSLNGVIAGSHYNRCWKIHSLLSETLERLLFEKFIATAENVHMPEVLNTRQQFATAEEHYESMAGDQSVAAFLKVYRQFEEEVRRGVHGKTSQFWMMNYIDVMRKQHLIHLSVQTNNFFLRLHGLKSMLPLMFALDKQNYARYGSLYVNTLETLDETHPGCKELIEHKGLSVQAQDRYPCRTAVDQRGEQTINRDAKVSGGIKFFASDEKAIMKWTLNRAAQAKNTQELYSLAGVKQSEEVHKMNRPSEVLNSEKSIRKLYKVITKEYLNPFDHALNPDYLYNLSSGIPVDDELADSILSVNDLGRELYDDFIESRIKSTAVNIHDPIKRQKRALFRDVGKKVVITIKNKQAVVEANRNTLAKLLAYSAKFDKVIDFETALKYPLFSVPLSLGHPDGTRRTTAKSKFMEVVISYESSSIDPKELSTKVPKETVSAYLVDLMALIRSIPGICDTYHELAFKLISALPNGYDRIDIVADTYREKSLKDPERARRGVAGKVIVQSSLSKIPRNFSEFLKNGENKTRLIQLVWDVIARNRIEILEQLKCNELLYSMDGICHKISSETIAVMQELSSNQEEADTKLLLHANHALSLNSTKAIVVRSPSGDVDINILFLSMFEENSDKIHIDYGTGKNRKILSVGSIDMSRELKRALIGFHAFTGNDYVSSFFKKSKKHCWRLLEKNNRFVQVFQSLGTDWYLSDSLFAALQEVVCHMYGKKKVDVDEVRYDIFKDVYEKKGKIQDLSLLPPCKQALQLHCKRANYVAKIWKSSFLQEIEVGKIEDNGWSDEGEIAWVGTVFPEDVTEILETDGDDDTEDFQGLNNEDSSDGEDRDII